jgi:hypothetical protein
VGNFSAILSTSSDEMVMISTNPHLIRPPLCNEIMALQAGPDYDILGLLG